jgi:hypothetical protein
MLVEEKNKHKRARCLDIIGHEQEELDEIRNDLNEALHIILDAELFLQAKTNVENKRQDFCCSLSKLFFEDPVVASDGMTYERAYILRWLLDEKGNVLLPFQSPTGGTITHRFLNPSILSKQVIDKAIHEEFEDLKRKREEDQAARAPQSPPY